MAAMERLASWLLWGLVVLVIYDAFTRYFFHSGSMMIQELQWHLFDAVMLFSLSVTLRHKGHVRVDVFYHRFTPLWQERLELIASLLLIIPFSVLVIYVSLDFVHMSFMQGEGSANPGGLPYRFVVKSLMIVGFVLLALQALQDSVKLYKSMRL